MPRERALAREERESKRETELLNQGCGRQYRGYDLAPAFQKVNFPCSWEAAVSFAVAVAPVGQLCCLPVSFRPGIFPKTDDPSWVSKRSDVTTLSGCLRRDGSGEKVG